MATVVTNDQFRVSQQNIRNLRLKIDLLNYEYKVVDQLEGWALNGSITINADSELRRTATINMVVTDSSFDVNPGGKIWMDKYLQIWIGIDDLVTGEPVWHNMGIYLLNSPTRTYDPSTNNLSFQALDLMSKLTGIRNGNIEGTPTIIPVGSSIREAMISCVDQLGGFKKYIIEDNPQKVPIEIKIEREGTVFDLIRELRDIVPNYEVFFDVNGVFHYQKIPSGKDDPILIDNNTWDGIVTGVEISTDFEYVKNSVEVWGHLHNPSVVVEEITVNGDTYVGKAIGLDPTSFTEYVVLGMVPPSIIQGNPKLKINDMAAMPIVNEDGTPAIFPQVGENIYYCLQVMEGGQKLLYLGEQQIFAKLEDTNPDSPFYVNGSVGRILKVFTGSEYDVIWTDDLALQRAKYELYLHDRLQDTITLKGLPLYYIDVNILIEYINQDIGIVPKKWNVRTQTYDLPSYFMIKSVTLGLDHTATMSVTACRYYPEYWW